MVIRSPQSLGQALRRARREAGLTQAELSRRTGLRQATISRLEAGSGTLESLFRIMTVLKLDTAIDPRAIAPTSMADLF